MNNFYSYYFLAGITEAEITQMVADAVAATADVTVDSTNVDTYVTDISAQITDELSQLTSSTDCLGKGTVGGAPNAVWIKVSFQSLKKS